MAVLALFRQRGSWGPQTPVECSECLLAAAAELPVCARPLPTSMSGPGSLLSAARRIHKFVFPEAPGLNQLHSWMICLHPSPSLCNIFPSLPLNHFQMVRQACLPWPCRHCSGPVGFSLHWLACLDSAPHVCPLLEGELFRYGYRFLLLPTCSVDFGPRKMDGNAINSPVPALLMPFLINPDGSTWEPVLLENPRLCACPSTPTGQHLCKESGL